jgi:cytochrome bd-type quinol oxidase subunit 1
LSSTWVIITLVIFVLTYGIFGVVDGVLMVRYGRRELSAAEEGEPTEAGGDGPVPAPDETPVLTY